VDFKEMLRSIDDRRKKVPLFMLKDQPEIYEKWMFFKKVKEDYNDKAKALEEEMKVAHEKFWKIYENDLIELGFLTQAEVDADVDLNISDGVAFKYVKDESGE
jgi:hypothetical protein